MSTVPQWSGREVRALREARRMSVREFATHLGVSDRMVSKWEASGEAIRPRPMNQAALDTSLAMATPEARTRFNQLAGARTVHIESARPAVGIRHLVRHPIDGKLMTLVEAGVFTAEGEDPVWLPAYYIDVVPTTSLDYSRFVAATGHRPPAQWPGGRYLESLADSLIHVSSSDAQAYATWASKSLPTPAQWDRAAGATRVWSPATSPSGAPVSAAPAGTSAAPAGGAGTPASGAPSPPPTCSRSCRSRCR